MNLVRIGNNKKLEKDFELLKEQYASLENMFKMTTNHLKEGLDDLTVSEKKLAETNKNLTDSINYAKLIQNAFTVQEDKLKKRFPESFLLDEPKDVLSGDFVWAVDKFEKKYLGVGDCTGHGVPGAMLSVFIVSNLNQIINTYGDQSPAYILDKLDKQIKEYLSQNVDRVKDSAEISIIEYDPANQKLLFAAANRPLVHIRRGEIKIYKGSKLTLGDTLSRFSSVKNIEVKLQTDDMLYMFSDGFVDQFGGPNNKKFLTKRLLALLTDMADLPMEDQNEKIESTFIDWRGDNPQIDDVLLLGFRV